jgi:hypothetical protein
MTETRQLPRRPRLCADAAVPGRLGPKRLHWVTPAGSNGRFAGPQPQDAPRLSSASPTRGASCGYAPQQAPTPPAAARERSISRVPPGDGDGRQRRNLGDSCDRWRYRRSSGQRRRCHADRHADPVPAPIFRSCSMPTVFASARARPKAVRAAGRLVPAVQPHRGGNVRRCRRRQHFITPASPSATSREQRSASPTRVPLGTWAIWTNAPVVCIVRSKPGPFSFRVALAVVGGGTFELTTPPTGPQRLRARPGDARRGRSRRVSCVFKHVAPFQRMQNQIDDDDSR